jgi:hypothetical protein
MNNIYSYSDQELEHIAAALPKVLNNVRFLVAPIDDDQLYLTNAFLLGGLIAVKREQKKRREKDHDWLLGNGPRETA